MTDLVNVRNNSYHIQGINTSLRGSLLSCRVWVGIMVVFQVDQLFKAGMKHAMELAVQRAPQPFRMREQPRAQLTALYPPRDKRENKHLNQKVFCLSFLLGISV